MLRRWMSTCARAGQRISRDLHIRHSTTKDLIKLENKDASHISLGVGFVVAYSPNSSNSVWVRPSDCSPNLFGELGAWHHLRISTTDDAPIIWKVACGRSHVVALTTEGKVYGAGLNHFGQCGYSISQTSENFTPLLSQMRDLDERINQVVCGLDHTLLLAESGGVFSCGWGADGQTGIGGYSDAASPTRVQLPSDLCFSSVHTCADTSFARTGDGLVFGWGNNEYGQLGVPTDDPQISTPVPLDLSDLDGKLVSMATGGAFTAFSTSRGSVYLAGYSIEDPSISHDQSSGKLIHPHQMCRLRKIHHGDATKTADYVCEVHAGLHYLIGEVSPRRVVIVWGRDPHSEKEEEDQANGKKLVFHENVQSVAYGPTSVATVLSDNKPNAGNFHS